MTKCDAPFLSLLLFCVVDAHSVTCAQALASYRGDASGAIIHDGKARAQAYPLDFTLELLGLTPAQLGSLGSNIVLLGEGYGTLFPALYERPDVDVRAVDPIYALDPIPSGFMGNLLRNFLRKYRDTGRLLAESADQTSISANWADSVLSNLLLNNFLDEEGEQLKPIARDTVFEALRIVKPGGLIIFSTFLDQHKLERLAEEIKSARKEQIDSLVIQAGHVEINYDDFGPFARDKAGQTRRTSISRLMIRKR